MAAPAGSVASGWSPCVQLNDTCSIEYERPGTIVKRTVMYLHNDQSGWVSLNCGMGFKSRLGPESHSEWRQKEGSESQLGMGLLATRGDLAATHRTAVAGCTHEEHDVNCHGPRKQQTAAQRMVHGQGGCNSTSTRQQERTSTGN